MFFGAPRPGAAGRPDSTDDARATVGGRLAQDQPSVVEFSIDRQSYKRYRQFDILYDNVTYRQRGSSDEPDGGCAVQRG